MKQKKRNKLMASVNREIDSRRSVVSEALEALGHGTSPSVRAMEGMPLVALM